ncbi:RluA family pseudouridine synthase [Lichenifustis flavocetrariae]|uniref:Pseudouridine synthase n=1 Tax=Lichenifustis flavocetrariae TaxID=2949735 RepID=A0AA41YUP1_9HYPH|nr:RluA family pseudouridine synthase [Lichenifustis flavocetrariae]MCW6507372.1 RluA family pseudouridine synthase [Lichenifustis flavocetrariae]
MSTGLFHVSIDQGREGQRLDRILADAAEAAGLNLSRTRLQRLIADGHVRVGDVVARSGSEKPPLGTILSLNVPEPTPALPQAQVIPFDVVFEDGHLLVLDKPAGLVVHPSAGHADGTLVNALIAHCGDTLSGIGGVKRPGIVHRLDKDTSGLLVVAKSDAAHAGLAALFADHGRSGSLVREYQAFIWGVPDRTNGMIDLPLGRDPHNRLKVAVVPEDRGRHAVTHWRREARFGDLACRIQCRLETGRTHQIRVHFAAIGHPLVGDAVYGAGFRTKAERLCSPGRDTVLAFRRQALHASTLGFTHPVTEEELMFRSDMPTDLEALATAFRGA